MKRTSSTFKHVFMAVVFAAMACTAAVFAELAPAEKITWQHNSWHNADSTGGAPGDTTDGGIRFPGIGH